MRDEDRDLLNRLVELRYKEEKAKAKDTARSDINVLFLQQFEEKAARIAELEAWRPKLIEYTRHKLDLGDWHGVADGAMDLRDLDSELDGLRY